MDHKLSYRGPILVIQKPNIKLSDRATSSLKDASPNSHFFPVENQSQNLNSRFGRNRAAWGSPGKRTITLVIKVRFG